MIPVLLCECPSELLTAEDEEAGGIDIEAVIVTTELALVVFSAVLVARVPVPLELSVLNEEVIEDPAVVESVLDDDVRLLILVLEEVDIVLLPLLSSASGQIPVVHGSVEQHPMKFPIVHTYHSLLPEHVFA